MPPTKLKPVSIRPDVLAPQLAYVLAREVEAAEDSIEDRTTLFDDRYARDAKLAEELAVELALEAHSVRGGRAADARGAGAAEVEEEKRQVLRRSAHHGEIEAIRSLVEQGVDINCDCSQGLGHTPLNVAAARKHSTRGVITRLLQLGADPAQQTFLGHTALHLAAKNGQAENVRELLQHVLDRTGVLEHLDLLLCVDHQGNTALDEAHRRGDQQVVAMLQSAIEAASS